MTKIITNNNQVPNGGYALSNVTIAGGGGITYTTATGASNWANGVSVAPYYTKKPKVEITDKDLVIDGLSLRDFMQSVQDQLLIPGKLNRNEGLEQEFDELKQHADRYYELERKFLEQKQMWETLKKE